MAISCWHPGLSLESQLFMSDCKEEHRLCKAVKSYCINFFGYLSSSVVPETAVPLHMSACVVLTKIIFLIRYECPDN